MNKTDRIKKSRLFIAFLALMFLLTSLLSSCIREQVDNRMLIVYDARGVEITEPLTIELQPTYQFSSLVLGGDGEVVYSSDDTSIIDVEDDGSASVKSTGTAKITAQIKDSEIKQEFSITVTDAEILELNNFKVAVDQAHDTTFVVKANEVHAGLNVSVIVNKTYSKHYILDGNGSASISLEELGLKNTGLYDVSIVFPNNPNIIAESVGVLDIAKHYDFVASEGWQLSPGSTTPTLKNSTLSINEGWGAVSIPVTLNNATKRYVKVTVEGGTGLWGIKLNSPEIYGTTNDFNLINDRTVVAGETIIVDVAQFKDSMLDESLRNGGDYTVEFKVFVVSKTGTQNVTIKSIEFLNDDGELREGVRLNEYIPSGDIKIDTHSANLQVGNIHEIKFRGDNSTFGYTFSTSDPSVAVVDSRGRVYGVSSGNAKIYIKSFDGTKTDEINITVYIPVDSIESSRDVFKVDGKTSFFNLKEELTIVPANATAQGLTYSIIQGEEFAVIDDNGYLTWTGAGTVKIRITSQDSFKRSKDVTIEIIENYIPVMGMSLGDQTNMTYQVDQEFVVTPTFLPADASDQSYTTEVLTPGMAYEKPYSGNGTLLRTWGIGEAVIRFRSVANPEIYVDCNLDIYMDYVYKHDSTSEKDHLYFSFWNVPDEKLPEHDKITKNDYLKIDFYDGDTIAVTYTQPVGVLNHTLINKADIKGLEDGKTYTLRAQLMRNGKEAYGYWITSIEECSMVMNMVENNWGGTDNALFYPTSDGTVKVGYSGGPATINTMFDYDASVGGLIAVRVKLPAGGTYAFKMGTDPYVDSVTFIPDGGDEGWFVFSLTEWHIESGNYYVRFYLAQNGTILVLSDVNYYNGLTPLKKIIE